MPDKICFGSFELDLETAELCANGQSSRLPEQQFRILQMLLLAEGRVVLREEIRNRLWPNDTVVEFDRSINTAMMKLRIALGDTGDKPRMIETLPRRGYRLMVAVDQKVQESPGPGDGLNKPGSLIGQRVSHYRVLEVVDGGGMGVVYKALDLKLDRAVALKFLPEEMGEDEKAIARFEREARAVSALDHPNICPIYEFGEQEGRPFIVMPLLEGRNLRDTLAARDGDPTAVFPLERILELSIQIASGLEAAHDKGIIHRDIKPANIFITQRGVAKIVDFGIAKMLPTGKSSESEAGDGPSAEHSDSRTGIVQAPFITRTGIAVGSAGYMSPEQLRGEKLDARSDLFSFGLILHEMASGSHPFRGSTSAELANAILADPPAPLPPNVPRDLCSIICRCLEKSPFERYQRATDLRAALEAARPDLALPSSVGIAGKWYAAAFLATLILVAPAAWQTRTQIPAVLRSQQITFSPEPKERPLVSDGARLYFQSQGEPVAMALSGGVIARLRFSEPGLQILDISHDGSKALASKAVWQPATYRMGTLWVASPIGGAARKLGIGSAQDARWSPDGSSILFSEKGVIYTAHEDGSDRKKIWEAPGAIDSLGFSPNGRELTCSVVTKQNSREWRLQANGRGPHLLFPDWPANSDQWFGQWTPGGKHFVFISDREGRGNVYELVTPRWYEFWRRPTAVLITGNQIDIRGLAPGPDGESLFVLGEADKGALQVLDRGTGKYLPFLNNLPAASFVISPDRQWMAYSEYPSGSLWKSRPDGTEATQLTTSPAYMMQWSRNGQSLAYSDGYKIYVIPADGGMPRKLIAGGNDHEVFQSSMPGGGDREGFPSWLPGDNSIAFSYYSPEKQHNEGIHLVDVASGKTSIMSDTQGLALPSWSPDGRYLVAIAHQPDRIMLYSAGTKTWTELRQFDTPWGFWIWSSDSKSIYMRVVQGGVGVYRLSVPEGKLEKVSTLDGVNIRADVDFSPPSLSADGRPVLMSHVGVAQIYSLHWDK